MIYNSLQPGIFTTMIGLLLGHLYKRLRADPEIFQGGWQGTYKRCMIDPFINSERGLNIFIACAKEPAAGQFTI